MRLDLDFGNYSIKAQLSDATTVWPMVKFSSVKQLADYCASYPVQRVCVLSVRHDPAVRTMLEQWLWQQYALRPEYARVMRQACGVTNAYDDYKQLGVDRWAGMVAAYHQEVTCHQEAIYHQEVTCHQEQDMGVTAMHASASILVADCGTAITLDWLHASGRHLAGVILPGLELAYFALQEKTSIQINNHPATNSNGLSALGYQKSAHAPTQWDTQTAVALGIDTMLNSFLRQQILFTEQYFDRAYTIYLTGGNAHYFRDIFPAEKLQCHADLTLQGLRLLLP